MTTSFLASSGTGSVLEYLAANGGELTMADLVAMLDMCQIATCHERGERHIRQMGRFVEQGGILRISEADRHVIVVDELGTLRSLILRCDSALDIATDPALRPADD